MSDVMEHPRALVDQAALDAEAARLLAVNDKDLRDGLRSLRQDIAKATTGINASEGWNLSNEDVVAVLGDGSDSDKMGKLIELNSRLAAHQDESNRRLSIKAAERAALEAEGNMDSLIAGTYAQPAGRLPGLRGMVADINRTLADRGVSGVEAARLNASFETNTPFGDIVNAAFLTSNDGIPEMLMPGYHPAAIRQPMLIDVVASSPGVNGSAYIQETAPVYANKKADEGKGAAANRLGESTFVRSKITDTYEARGHYVPVSEEELVDGRDVAGYLNDRMMLGVMIDVDKFILSELLSAPGLPAAENKTADGTDVWQAILETQARLEDEAPDQMVSAGYLRPVDFTNLVTQDTSKDYVRIDPTMMAPKRAWGIPLVCSGNATDKVITLGAFMSQMEYKTIGGIMVEYGRVDKDFIELMWSVRAYTRISVRVYRPSAFARLTVRA